MIKLKARQVLLLLEILESAWQYELVVYEKVFRRLRMEEVGLPNFKAIKQAMYEEFDVLNKLYAGLIDRGVIEERARKARKTIDVDLKRVYLG